MLTLLADPRAQSLLMPMLATSYALHFASRFLVAQYAEARRTKEEDRVADVHALSAGRGLLSCPALKDGIHYSESRHAGPLRSCANW